MSAVKFKCNDREFEIPNRWKILSILNLFKPNQYCTASFLRRFYKIRSKKSLFFSRRTSTPTLVELPALRNILKLIYKIDLNLLIVSELARVMALIKPFRFSFDFAGFTFKLPVYFIYTYELCYEFCLLRP